MCRLVELVRTGVTGPTPSLTTPINRTTFFRTTRAIFSSFTVSFFLTGTLEVSFVAALACFLASFLAFFSASSSAFTSFIIVFCKAFSSFSTSFLALFSLAAIFLVAFRAFSSSSLASSSSYRSRARIRVVGEKN